MEGSDSAQVSYLPPVPPGEGGEPRLLLQPDSFEGSV